MTENETADPSPWPETEPVVFLCDASSGVERSLLADWVRATDPRPAGSPEPELVHIDLEGKGTSGSAALSAVLERTEAHTLAPLRVVWLPEDDKARSRPRLRNILIGDPRNPRPFTGFMHRGDTGRARCIAGAPATVEELRAGHAHVAEDDDSTEDFDAFVLRQAGIALDVRERRFRGQRYKVPRFVIQGIESSKRYQAATTKAAQELQESPKDVRAQTHKYLEEMVATPSALFIDWMGMLTRRITSLGYKEIVTDPEGVERARTWLRDHPVALLWTHKSHVDAISLMSVMYDKDFPLPHSMGGINMAFAGVGYAGRRAGTVYIRRSFGDKPLYKLALQQYLGYLMAKRFPLSWSFEGTRSRTGKLGPPRYGLLKYAIEAAHATDTHDLHLIPVSINYDLIGETTDYAREESGQAKEAENLGWFMEYLRKLRAPMGNIYLDFADPIVLEGRAPEATPELLSQIAMETARRVNACVPVTLAALMCLAALGAAPQAMTYPELDRALRELMVWLRSRDIRMTQSLENEDIPELETLAENIFRGGVISRVQEGSETLFEIGSGQYPVASYYRNTIIHYFLNKAIAEVSLARAAEAEPDARLDTFWEAARWLRSLTKREFYHTPSDQFADAIDRELSTYETDWQKLLATGSRSDVNALLARFTPLVSHATLLSYLEAYWIVGKVLSGLPTGELPSESDVVNKALRLGRLSLRRRRISSEASIGQAMFKNAFDYAKDKNLGTGDSPELAEWVTVLEDATRLIRRIGAIAHTELFTPDAIGG